MEKNSKQCPEFKKLLIKVWVLYTALLEYAALTIFTNNLTK
jgi:hypothetical protein